MGRVSAGQGNFSFEKEQKRECCVKGGGGVWGVGAQAAESKVGLRGEVRVAGFACGGCSLLSLSLYRDRAGTEGLGPRQCRHKIPTIHQAIICQEAKIRQARARGAASAEKRNASTRREGRERKAWHLGKGEPNCQIAKLRESEIRRKGRISPVEPPRDSVFTLPLSHQCLSEAEGAALDLHMRVGSAAFLRCAVRAVARAICPLLVARVRHDTLSSLSTLAGAGVCVCVGCVKPVFAPSIFFPHRKK